MGKLIFTRQELTLYLCPLNHWAEFNLAWGMIMRNNMFEQVASLRGKHFELIQFHLWRSLHWMTWTEFRSTSHWIARSKTIRARECTISKMSFGQWFFYLMAPVRTWFWVAVQSFCGSRSVASQNGFHWNLDTMTQCAQAPLGFVKF